MFEFIEQLCQYRGYQIVEKTPSKGICFNPKTNRYIQVFMCEDSKLDMSYFYKSYDYLEKYNQNNPTKPTQHIIFIYRVATIQIKKLKLYKEILSIEFFRENELKRLLIGNRFIPKHTKVHPDLYREIVQKFGRDNLPTLLLTDPIARLNNFEMNDIVQIERNDVIYYRLVISDD
jgi:DNA-directed RNA polymerase subunit H (RpoH/RPB5)